MQKFGFLVTIYDLKLNTLHYKSETDILNAFLKGMERAV